MPFTGSILARQVCAVALAVLAGAAQAADGDDLDVTGAAPKPADVGWEGAIGLLVAHRPAFSGSEGAVTKLTPGFFLRRGRLSMTNASGFVTRCADDVTRGVGIDLLQSTRIKASAGLR
jgi:outer membrane protein